MIITIETIGWIGSLCFALCGLPQAIQSFRTKSSEGINSGMLALWTLGEVLTLVYITLTTVQWPLIANYVFNLACLTVIIYYKRRPL
jgi:uncharacterized protein with PQ loop repeat